MVLCHSSPRKPTPRGGHLPLVADAVVWNKVREARRAGRWRRTHIAETRSGSWCELYGVPVGGTEPQKAGGKGEAAQATPDTLTLEQRWGAAITRLLPYLQAQARYRERHCWEGRHVGAGSGGPGSGGPGL